jgi:sugar diacid utilization regulator
VIADRQQRLISYSAGANDADPVRVETILNRASPPAMKDFVASLGIDRATSPLRAPANRELGSAPRVCLPVRYADRLLGYLWLIDSHEDLVEADILRAQHDAEQAGEILFRAERLEDGMRQRERDLLDGLLSHDSEAQRNAIALAQTRTVFDVGTYIRAVVVSQPNGLSALDEHRDDIASIEDRARRLWPMRQLLSLAAEGHCLFVLACAIDDEKRVRAFAGRAVEALDQRRPAVGSCAAGIGGLYELDGVRDSYQEALRASSVTASLGASDRVGEWERLGAYRVLSSLPADASGLDPMVAKLLAADTDGTLVTTLECYFDHAGDVKATSADLMLHRTSLYYRLCKAETVIGASLKEGDVRLAVHLGLKLARLQGHIPQSGRSVAPDLLSAG